MNGKTVFVTLVIFSLFFVSPYVSSFSLNEINYYLNNIVGYLVYDFKLITGMAGTNCVAPAFCDSDCNQENQQQVSGICPSPDICCEYFSYCGDGNADDGEECDFGESNGEVCEPVYGAGCSYCDSDCTLVPVDGASCGDGTCDAGEETCDGCPSDCEGITGAPVCDNGMTCIFGECTEEESFLCNNNLIEGNEICDGSDLNSKTCQTEGFDSGNLACLADCTGFDTSGCSNDQQPEYSPEETISSNEEDSTPAPTMCVDVNGVCSDNCVNGFTYYNNTSLDDECADRYGEGLICCVPAYVLVNEGESTDEESTEDKTASSVKSVEDYMIQESESVQTSPKDTNLEKGLNRIVMSPSYAMGGIWISFILTFLVVGISFYLHKRIYKKK